MMAGKEMNDVVLKSKNFKPHAIIVLRQAMERGCIGTHEISSILPVDRDSKKLSEVIIWLREYLDEVNIKILTGREAIEHRKSYPPAKIPRRTSVTLRRLRVKDDPLVEEGEMPWDTDEAYNNIDVGHQCYWYFNQIRKYPLISKEEEYALSKRIKEEGDIDARDKLVVSNLRWALYIARRFMGRGLDLDDLIQEGNMGLLTAAERFDYEMGFRFSTYSAWWIKQKIQRAIMDMGETIRRPAHIHQLEYKVLNMAGDLAIELGRIPTLEEIIFHCPEEGEKIKNILYRLRIDVISLDDIQSDNSHRQEGQADWHDKIPDNKELLPGQILEAKEELDASLSLIEDLLDVLSKIIDREQIIEVFKRRYGLWDNSFKVHTLERVGRSLKSTFTEEYLTRERIRQMVEEVWIKLDEEEIDMDHDRLINELRRVRLLEDLIHEEATL